MTARHSKAIARAACAGLFALALAAVPARAERVELDPGNMLRLSVMMLEQGRAEEARAFAEALHRRDPQDAAPLLVRSQAERELGLYGQSVRSARAAWVNAEDDGERYGAAMSAAQALASGGKRIRAQWWLRRAMQVAPDEGAKRVAERDFAYVRARSRLWLQFDVSLQPSNNVNNGSSADILWYWGFPLVISDDARALSGAEGSLGFTGKYRIQESERSKTDLRFSALQTAVWLSDEAKRQAPEAKGSDYAYASLDIGAEHAWKAGQGIEFRLLGTWGHTWYGGEPLSRVTRLAFSADKRIGPRLALRGGLSFERQDRRDSPVNSADMITANIGATLIPGEKADRFDLTLTLRDAASDSGETAHEMARLRLDWIRRERVLGAQFSLGLWAEARDYNASRYISGGREDRMFGGELSMVFEQADYMGFVPVMTLGTQRTDSNVGLFESDSLGVSVSVRSKF